MGCQSGDCRWQIDFSSGVCVGMYGLTDSLYHPGRVLGKGRSPVLLMQMYKYDLYVFHIHVGGNLFYCDGQLRPSQMDLLLISLNIEAWEEEQEREGRGMGEKTPGDQNN